MRDPERIPEIITLLHAAWAAYPDLRLGQLISNISQAGGWSSNDPFYAEDDIMVLGLQKLFENKLKEDKND
jgi:uncharacterized protein YihD (DUF1040 family)